MKSLRDLRLRAKVTLTLAAVFAAIVGVFLLILLPLHDEQRIQLLDQNKRLVATLRDNYQRYFIYDVLSENQDSLAINVADLARQPGVLWVRVESQAMDLAATSDEALIATLVGGEARDLRSESSPRPVLLVYRDGTLEILGGLGADLARVRPSETPWLPPWRVGSVDPGAPFEELEWNGESVLYSRAEMKAANEIFGGLHILYSLATVRRSEALTRTMFYGLVGSAFVLLLMLLNLFLSRLVIAPLTDVVEAMGRASKGKLDSRLPVRSRDEIGTMAGSFNRMVEKLESSKKEIEDYSRNLEDRVAERTGELRTSEERLRNTRNHLATVIANVATGVISLDEEGRITTFNQRAAEILSVPAQGNVGRSIDSVLSAGQGARICELIAPVRAGETKRKEDQVSLKRPQGHQILSVVASRLEGGAGRALGTVVVFDDLTQILASQRLEAWKQAVEKVIHEIKNPLTPVGLAAETLRTVYEEDREKFDQMFPSASAMILRSLSDLKSLISEFAQFSRLPPTILAKHDVNALVEQAMAPYQQGTMPGITIRCELQPQLPEIEADADQLKRVLLNVINNALEAMEGKGGELFVATQSENSSGKIAISVHDQGSGVDDVGKIFDPHYTTKVKGTGLGLVIARQIVEEHGGEIQVRSELGEGTTVIILLPSPL